MQEIGKLLPSVFKKQVRQSDPLWIEILVALWPRIVGKPIARQCRPSNFAAGTLTICAESRTWATQLRYLAEEIRAEINGFLGRPIVRKLRIRLVPQLDLFPSKIAVSAPSCCEPVPAPLRGLASIPDSEIARILAKSYAKYFARERR